MDHEMDSAFYEGWNIGAVSVKRVRLDRDGRVQAEVRKHGGDPGRAIRAMLPSCPLEEAGGAMVTGPQAAAFFSLPYLPESLCVEAALQHLGLAPDLVLSLGGETFTAYCLKCGTVHGLISSNRCAAGSGEFLVQQFGRMNMDLEQGIRAARSGRRVKLASRCSVHCKSDATHKLNKGECSPEDIAYSLIADLAARIAGMVLTANWPRAQVVLAGGLALNEMLVAGLRELLEDSRIEVPPASPYLEAFGAAVAAREANTRSPSDPESWLHEKPALHLETCPPLARFAGQVRRQVRRDFARLEPGAQLILGVDAGSTTTKAVLWDRGRGLPVAGSYLRTHGNPVRATAQCLEELRAQLPSHTRPEGDGGWSVVQAAVTGSGRDLVSVFLDNCLSFNEILAHARAAREAAPEVDTLFELGGQDAKFVALHSGIPVDYSMNDGCSAGTGSFLEEAASSDMQVPIERIGPLALEGAGPITFGERCAAFINTEVRAALQQGASREDVLAGLVYAITDNYLSRVVGARHIGTTILLQGGVALNPALAPAVAARTGMRVLVPAYPELMGCIGAAQMAADLLEGGEVEERRRELDSFGRIPMQVKGAFACKACGNNCEIQRIGLNGREYPFGGLCAKWEMQRRPPALRRSEGRDLVSLRQELMFLSFAPASPERPLGRIGLPLALSAYELYPLYARLLVELGYQVVLSRPGQGRRQSYAPICYPGELMHAAVDDLLQQGVDYLFLPSLRELPIPEGHEHGYLCPVVQDIAGVIRSCFTNWAAKILSPEIGLSERLRRTTTEEIVRMAEGLGVTAARARAAFEAALEHQSRFERAYRDAVQQALSEQEGPVVILIGRPYAAFAPEVNLSIPRKFASRGFTVVPADGLPFVPPANLRDVWHYTQGSLAAVDYARSRPDSYVCVLSSFSCGPDAIVHHRLRRELSTGKPFCFLEIDSHTAHAGIETRIGAFLDIIEEPRLASASRPATTAFRPARLEGQGWKMRIVDSAGRRVRLDEERVVHVLLADLPRITSRMVANFYGRFGWRTVIAPEMSYEILQKARRVCSGRECLPFLAMMGKVVAHLESRPRGELTVFHLLEQEGPCQIGAWYDALAMILERLGCGDAVAAWPTIRNNYLGRGDGVALRITAATVAGDLMEEVRASLASLAVEPSAALACWQESERELLQSASQGLAAAEAALKRISRRLAAVALRASAQETPKVLLFGGINRIFVDKPIRDFFARQRILAKTNDISEFLSLLEFEWMVRSGLAHGHLRPEEHFSAAVMAGDLVRGPDRAQVLRALRARLHCAVIGWLEKRWRRIMSGSGLLFSSGVPFRELARQAQDKLSWNGWTEAPCTLGRYYSSIVNKEFDGYVNVGAFNCTPANTATAVINADSNRDGVPYAAVEADGAVITPSQVRQLETVAAQCRRGRREV